MAAQSQGRLTKSQDSAATSAPARLLNLGAGKSESALRRARMGCYQFNSGTAAAASFGVSGEAASLTRHRTQEDCLNACKEGACCEGGSCTVKPKCRCQCTAGSCCGPDTAPYYDGITTASLPVCRSESKSACEARGGSFRCGVFCSGGGLAGDAAAGAGLNPIAVCRPADRPPIAEPVFKGVGTTCTGTSGYCCGPDTWQAQALIVGSGTVSFPSSQSFPKCGVGGSTRAACESAGGQWITSPCVSCAEVNEKTGIGGSQKFVCYPSPNPLP